MTHRTRLVVALAAAVTSGVAATNCAAARVHTPHRHHQHAHRQRARAHAAVGAGERAVHCDLFASPSGSDSTGNGSLAAPYATLQQLDSALEPGQTGCLRAGTYGSTGTWHDLTTSGTSTGRITITAYPGEAPRVDGWIQLQASYTTLSHLTIDGSNTFYKDVRSGTTCRAPVSEALSISGSNDTLEYDDYFQSIGALRGVGIGIGFYGNADGTVIRYDRLHDIGQCDQYDHSIYVASGSGVQIYDNWIWNSHGGQAVSVYPGATNARIYANVIDSSDSGFTIGDDGSSSVSGDRIYRNVVADSGQLTNPDHDWSMPGVFVNCYFNSASSRDNDVFDNDSFSNPGGASNGCAGSANVSLSDTRSVNPQFVDAGAHNYAVLPISPFAGWGLWNGR